MIGPGSDKSTQIANKINFDRAIIKGTNRVLYLWLLWGCSSAVLLGDQTPVLPFSYWLATVLVYSAELEEAHVDQTGCRPLSLLLYFLVHHTDPSLVLILLHPMWVFFFWSVNNLRCWMATGQPTSCQAPSPKLLFLPDETLDFLNTTDARHLIVLFWCIVIIQYQRGMICCCCSRLWFMGFTPVFELFTGLISLHLTRSSTEDGDLKMI